MGLFPPTTPLEGDGGLINWDGGSTRDKATRWGSPGGGWWGPCSPSLLREQLVGSQGLCLHGQAAHWHLGSLCFFSGFSAPCFLPGLLLGCFLGRKPSW